MSSLGSLTVTLKLNDQLTAEMKKVLAELGKVSAKGAKDTLKSQDIIFDTKKSETYRKKIDGELYRVTDTFKKTNKGWEQTGHNMARTTEDSFGQMMKSLFNFKSFFAKIMHYLTFSIGVQLVMGIKTAITSLIKNFAEFDKAISYAAAVSGYTGASFENARKKIAELSIELSRGTVYSANQVADALAEMGSAGYDVVNLTKEQFIPIIQYATAVQQDLKQSTYDVITVMKQFNMTLNDTAEIVDAFTILNIRSYATADRLREGYKYVGSMAGALGQSFIEVGAALAVLNDRGMEGGQAGQRLNMIFTQLLDPTEASKKTIEGLGLSLRDISPTTKSLTEILYSLQNANFAAADSAEMFRARTASSAITLVKAANEVAYYTRLVKENGGITETVAKTQLDTLSASFTQLSTKLIEAGNKIGEILKPALISLIDAFKGLIDIIGGIGSALSPVVTLFGNLKGVVFPLIAIVASLAIQMKLLGSVMGYNALQIFGTGQGFKNLGGSILVLGGAFTILSSIVGKFHPMLGMIVGILPLIIVGMKALIVQYNLAKMSIVSLLSSTMAISIIFSSLAAIFGITSKAVGVLVIAIGAIIVAWKAYKIAALAAAAANSAVRLSMGDLTALIPLILVGIGLIAGSSEEAEAKNTALAESFKKTKEALDSLIAPTKNLITGLETEASLIDQADAAYEIYEKDLSKVITTKKRLSDLEKEGNQNTQEYVNTQRDLLKLQQTLNTSETRMLSTSASIVNVLKQTGDAADVGIGAYQEIIASQDKLNTNSQTYMDLEEERIRLEGELNYYAATLGTNSEEYQNTLTNLNSVYTEQNRLKAEDIELTSEVDAATLKYNKALTEEEGKYKDIIEWGKELIKTTHDLMLAQDELAKFQTIMNKMTGIANDYNKYYMDSIKKLREQEEKLYEINLKQYKLTEDRREALRDLFDTLAEEGLLTQESIDAYVESETEQGELAGMQWEFAQALEGVGENADFVTDWMETYFKALDEGLTEEEAMIKANKTISTSSNGMYNALSDIVEVGSSAYNTFIDYATQMHLVHASTNRLANAIVPFTEDLVENEFASNNAAEGLDAYNKSMISTADEAEDVAKEIEKINAAMIDTSNNLILAVGKFPEVEFPTFNVDNYQKTIERMELRLEELIGAPIDLPKIVNKDFLKGLNLTEEQITEFLTEYTLSGEDIIDIDSLERGTSAFEDTIWHLNMSTGLFTDKTADSKSVMAAYTQYMSSYGVKGAEAYSISMLSASLTTKQLEKAGYDHNTVLQIIGGSMDGLSTRSGILWDSMNYDMLTTQAGLDTTATKIQTIKDLLDSLKSKSIVVDITENITRKYIEDTEDDVKWHGTLPDPGSNLAKDMWGIDIFDPKWWSEGWNSIIGGLSGIGSKKGELTTLPDGTVVIRANAKGGIHGLQHGITETKGPQQAIIGEAGAEAVVPLEGSNRKYGKSILQQILPKYFPDLAMMQAGGVAGALSTDTTIRQGGKQINITVSTDASELNSAIITFKDAITTFTTSNTTYISTLTPLINNFRDSLSDLLNTIQMFGITMISSSDYFYGQTTTASNMILSTATTFEKSIGIASTILYTNIIRLGKVLSTPIKVNVSVHTDGHQKGGIYNKATMGMFGEAGAEALIPLEGSNRKYGESLLREIIPSYYPDLMFQGGGLFTGGGVSSIDNSRNNEENYNIMGPVSINANNVEEIGRDLKYKYRSSK